MKNNHHAEFDSNFSFMIQWKLSFNMRCTVLIVNHLCIENHSTGKIETINDRLVLDHMNQSWNRSGNPAPVRPDRTRPDENLNRAGRNRIFASS
jgi:hypothetical protein